MAYPDLAFKFFVQFTFWATLYCALSLAAAGYCLHRRIEDGLSLDGRIIAVLALGGFFGLFVFMMTATSLRYIFLNLTNVDIIRRKMRVYQLAVRVPEGTPPSSQYGLITYPLPMTAGIPAVDPRAVGRLRRGAAQQEQQQRQPTPPPPQMGRDERATRTFAIVKTEMGENPWDLGPWGNWASVMGANPLDWILPVRRSPCATFESGESFYPMGAVYRELRERYGLGRVAAEEERDGTQLGELRRRKNG